MVRSDVRLNMGRVLRSALVSGAVGLLLLLFTHRVATASGLVVNEALVNEPDGKVSLEWFELFNSAQTPVTLLDDTLRIDNQFVAVFGNITLQPDEYLVVSRNVVLFEEHFGDSSGVWGDDSLLENYALIQLGFSLKNSAGELSISNDTTITKLVWPRSGSDGVSWERVTVGVDSVASSVDVSGATPGRANSVSPLGRDWEIVGFEIVPARGAPTRVDVTVRNSGTLALPSACLLVYGDPILSPVAQFGIDGDSLFCEPFSALSSSESVVVSVFVSGLGVYDTIGLAVAVIDERLPNNTIVTTILGVDFPPLLINEFLANPQAPLGSEWVELKNISSVPIDLRGWGLGDELGFGLLDTTGAAQLVIQSGDYLVLAQDPFAFSMFYNQVPTPNVVIGWRTLNNAGDMLRLIDRFGFLVDSVTYSTVFDANVSWSRSEEEGTHELWGRSAQNGGTPSDSNRTLLTASAAGLSVSINPNPFSPDGDGIDEATLIEIKAPDGGEMSVVVYDSYGRVVRRLFDGAPFSGSLNWDGRTDSGRRVPVGLYIIYVEIENTASIKKTVVVAR